MEKSITINDFHKIIHSPHSLHGLTFLQRHHLNMQHFPWTVIWVHLVKLSPEHSEDLT